MCVCTSVLVCVGVCFRTFTIFLCLLSHLHDTSPSPCSPPPDPVCWSPEQVEEWIEYCKKELQYSNFSTNTMNISGSELCHLSREFFISTLGGPKFVGDQLYNALEKLRAKATSMSRTAQHTSVYQMHILCACVVCASHIRHSHMLLCSFFSRK